LDTGNGVGVDVMTSLVEDGELHAPASVSTCFDFKIEKVSLHVVKHCSAEENAFVVAVTSVTDA